MNLRTLVLAPAVLWVLAPSSMASQLAVDLRVPTPLEAGRVYEAELHVLSQTAIPDAYVKISLPYAFRVVSGRTAYRGRLEANTEFVLRAGFEVTGTPAGTIAGKAVALVGDGRLETVFGKGQILYCRVVNGSVALSERSPAEEEDLRLEAEIKKPGGADWRLLAGQHLQRNEARSIVKEDSGGARYRSPLLGSALVPENIPIRVKLDADQSSLYRFSGHRGDRLWVTAKSEDLDPHLALLRSDGTVVAEDDDGGGMLNARIPAQGVFELSSDDTYFVVAFTSSRAEEGRVELQVQNFSRSQVAPGSVLPNAEGTQWKSEDPDATGTSLSGTIVYNAADGNIAPVRFATVKLFRVGLLFDTPIATAQADGNGNVAFGVPAANQADTLYFKVCTQDGTAMQVSVQDPLLGLNALHCAERPKFTLPASPAATFGTWNVASVGENGPFLVYDAAIEGYLVSTQVLQFTPPPVTVSYPLRSFKIFAYVTDVDAHYQSNGIYLSESYLNSPDTVLHEYGHFIADRAGFLGPVGGEHFFPFRQHIDPKMAWNEGWATFFAVAGQNARGKLSKVTYVSSHPNNLQNYSLEDGHNPGAISNDVTGDDNEGSVQFSLWDLFERAQDYLPVAGAYDTAALGLKPIFDVARTGSALYTTTGSVAQFNVDCLEKFYDGLFQQESFNSAQASAIQAVFRDQGTAWQTPPSSPTALAFRFTGGLAVLEWQPGSANTTAYVVQQKLPGQASFTSVATVLAPSCPLSNVQIGTVFRVYAANRNTGRFSAPFVSPYSQEVTYTGPPAAPPTINVDKAQLSFTFNSGGSAPAPQIVNITNGGGGTLAWTAAADVPWLALSPTSGTAPSAVSVSVNPGNLSTGSHPSTITVSAPGATAASIPVTLSITAVPVITSVLDAAGSRPGLSSGTWVAVYGTNLATTARGWRADEIIGGVLPTQLDGVSATINGKPAALCYISPTQVNVQVPTDAASGPVQLRITTAQGSGAATVQMQQFSPGLFTFDGKYAAAQHADYSYVGRPSLLSGVGTTPAKPRETVVLYGTGFGPTTPAIPAGQLVTQGAPLANTASAWVGGTRATVEWAGLVGAGLWQLNITIPADTPDGDAVTVAEVGGVQTQGGVYLTVQR